MSVAKRNTSLDASKTTVLSKIHQHKQILLFIITVFAPCPSRDKAQRLGCKRPNIIIININLLSTLCAVEDHAPRAQQGLGLIYVPEQFAVRVFRGHLPYTATVSLISTALFARGCRLILLQSSTRLDVIAWICYAPVWRWFCSVRREHMRNRHGLGFWRRKTRNRSGRW